MVTTIVHHHMHATTPMDENTHIMSIENEKSHGEAKSMETNQTKIRAANSTVVMIRKVDPHPSWERTQEEQQRQRAWIQKADTTTSTAATRKVASS